VIDFDLSNFEKYLVVLGVGPVPGRVDGSGFTRKGAGHVYHISCICRYGTCPSAGNSE
jgi:hypothetical protein